MVASWKLESSATSQPSAGRAASSPVMMVPMLPTASAPMPAACSRCVVSEVVVVFPLVPVMATHRSGLSRKANSGSPMTSLAHARAAEKNAENSEIPGEATARS